MYYITSKTKDMILAMKNIEKTKINHFACCLQWLCKIKTNFSKNNENFVGWCNKCLTVQQNKGKGFFVMKLFTMFNLCSSSTRYFNSTPFDVHNIHIYNVCEIMIFLNSYRMVDVWINQTSRLVISTFIWRISIYIHYITFTSIWRLSRYFNVNLT